MASISACASASCRSASAKRCCASARFPSSSDCPLRWLGQAAFVLGATLLVALLSGGILRAAGRQTSFCVVELGLRAIKLSLRRGKLRRGLFSLRIELGPTCGQLIRCAGSLGVDLSDGGLQLRRHIGKLSRACLLELRLKLASLRHGLVVFRLCGVKLSLGLRYGRLSLLALLGKRAVPLSCCARALASSDSPWAS